MADPTRAWRTVRPRLLFLLHRLFAGLAVELTPEQPSGPLLVIAPHADDETLGCGATILRARRSGRRVVVVIVSDGSQSVRSATITPRELADLRIAEATAAVAALGVGREEIVFLGFPDTQLTENQQAVADVLRRHIDELRPAEIYAPYGIDGHRDHRAVAAALTSLIDAGAVGCPVYEYPLWFWPRRAVEHLAMPAALRRLRKVSTAGLLGPKRQAMDAYRSQSENFTGEPGAWYLTETTLGDFFQPEELFFQRVGRDRQTVVSHPSA